MANLIASGRSVFSNSVAAAAWKGSLIDTSIFDTRMLKIDPFEINVLAAEGVVKTLSPATVTSILVGAEATFFVENVMPVNLTNIGITPSSSIDIQRGCNRLLGERHR